MTQPMFTARDGDAESLPSQIRKISFQLPQNHPAQTGLFAAHAALIAAQARASGQRSIAA